MSSFLILGEGGTCARSACRVLRSDLVLLEDSASLDVEAPSCGIGAAVLGWMLSLTEHEERQQSEKRREGNLMMKSLLRLLDASKAHEWHRGGKSSILHVRVLNQRNGATRKELLPPVCHRYSS